VSTTNIGFEEVHGGFGYGDRNQKGNDILDFAISYNPFIPSTFFRKMQSHLVTFSSSQHSSQIDLVLIRRMDRRACLDCKVIPRECVVAQHKLVVTDFRFHACVLRVKGAKITRTKCGSQKVKHNRRRR
jgi:hypothetical protein